MPARLFLVEDPWVNWDWVSRHIPLITDQLTQHVRLTVIAVFVGLVLALPLGIAAYRLRWLRNPILVVFGVFYTIPSISLFVFLIPFTGISETTAEVGVVGYTILILVRNILVGLESVSPDVLDAADGMGYRQRARLLRIELPLALPAIFAGIRIATVSTIGLVTITAIIGLGGAGQLIYQGFILNFHTPLVVGVVLSVALAVIADGSLLVLQRLAVPWARTA